MHTITMDVDSALENNIRALLHDIQKTAPGVSLRALRVALWTLGMECKPSDILKVCLTQGRPHGTPARPDVPLTHVRKGRPSDVPDAAREYLRSQGLTLASRMTAAQAAEYNALVGTDRANAEIKPPHVNRFIVRKKGAK